MVSAEPSFYVILLSLFVLFGYRQASSHFGMLCELQLQAGWILLVVFCSSVETLKTDYPLAIGHSSLQHQSRLGEDRKFQISTV